MTNNLSNLDVIIIGGGAAGIMAAISSLECNKKVLLIEKKRKNRQKDLHNR